MTLHPPSLVPEPDASKTPREALRLDLPGGITIALPEEALDALADALADRLAERRTDENGRPRWLYGDKGAAEYLGWPLGRVQKLSARGLLPFHRIGQRKAYRSDELDAVLGDYTEGRI
jgi:hypothetical protein